MSNPGRDHGEGLGLGLAIVSRLAKLLGAKLEVASQVGRGSRFSLFLPFDDTERPAAFIQAALDDVGGRVLIIENNYIIRLSLEAMLNDWGAYFGLAPRRYQSGEVDYIGNNFKCGDRRVRTLLYEAANVLLTRCKAPMKLKDWALAIV